MPSSDHFRPSVRFVFRCPLCGSTAYDYVTVLRADGSILQTQTYQCGGCSVLFRDPERFTKLEQVEGVEHLALPSRPKKG